MKNEDIMDTIETLLSPDGPGLTPEEVRGNWPVSSCPGKSKVRGLLEQGRNDGRWVRSGMGVRKDPWRYRLPESGSDSFRLTHAPRGRNESEEGPRRETKP